MLFRVFFFFKQKTAYEIGTGDWSSDVCSSDLIATACNARNFVLAFDGVPNLNLLSADGVRNASSTANSGMDAVLVTASRATGQIVDVQFDNSASDLQDLNINIIAN